MEHDRPSEERNQISNLRALAQVVGGDKVYMRGSRIFLNRNEKDDNEDTRSCYEREYRHDELRDLMHNIIVISKIAIRQIILKVQ